MDSWSETVIKLVVFGFSGTVFFVHTFLFKNSTPWFVGVYKSSCGAFHRFTEVQERVVVRTETCDSASKFLDFWFSHFHHELLLAVILFLFLNFDLHERPVKRGLLLNLVVVVPEIIIGDDDVISVDQLSVGRWYFFADNRSPRAFYVISILVCADAELRQEFDFVFTERIKLRDGFIGHHVFNGAAKLVVHFVFNHRDQCQK